VKYYNKQHVIEAFKWTGGPDQDPVWVCDAIKAGRIKFEKEGTPDGTLLIVTGGLVLRAKRGDYIIQGAMGDVYPCAADIFEETHEVVYDGTLETIADQDAGIYYTDYPTEPIGDGNPYYRCCACKRSDPQINGRLEGHVKGCSWVEQKRKELEAESRP
jgi:hypothetical protein